MSEIAYSYETFKAVLRKLHASAGDFGADDVRLAFEHLLATPPAATPAQIGAFLSALQLTGVERQPSTLAAASEVLLAHAIVPGVEGDASNIRADIVGTGGDGHNVFNVSTTAAIVAAGAGLRVIKHGNYAATSSSGSADLLLALGCSLSSSSATLSAAVPFQFLLAATYHPALASLAPIRKQLPFRTLFNLLGPLANPAQPTHMVLGVAKPELGPLFAAALAQRRGCTALVVCGAEGLDELSCAGATHVWSVDGATGSISESTLTPEDFGLPRHSLELVRGHSPAENAHVLRALLQPGFQAADREVPLDLGPVRDFVCLNAAALLVVSGIAKDWKDGVAKALESVSNGNAWAALEAFRVQNTYA